jgi:hypothetical protein
MLPVSCNTNVATERTKEFEYNFLIICKYLNLVKKQKIVICWQKENSQVVTPFCVKRGPS